MLEREDQAVRMHAEEMDEVRGKSNLGRDGLENEVVKLLVYGEERNENS